MQQITLPLISDYNYHLSEFIVSESNKAAWDIIENWQNGWGYDPYPYALLIYGPKSSGKTYLTKIWQNLSGAKFISSLDQNYQALINSANNFIIEDIETLPGDGLFHLFNLANENKKYLLMTGSESKFNFELRDIESRLHSIRKIGIGFPDDNLVKMLIFKHFASNSLIISQHAFDFLVARLPRECDKIIKFANKINQFALSHKRPITIPLIKEVLEG